MMIGWIGILFDIFSYVIFLEIKNFRWSNPVTPLCIEANQTRLSLKFVPRQFLPQPVMAVPPLHNGLQKCFDLYSATTVAQLLNRLFCVVTESVWWEPNPTSLNHGGGG